MTICPYCNKSAKLVSGSEIYGAKYSYFNIWLCKPCNAHVGCHPNGDIPLGTPAKHKLRELRKCVHGIFDQLWKSKKMNRHHAYRYLGGLMELKEKDCHVGLFTEEQCLKVLKLLK